MRRRLNPMQPANSAAHPTPESIGPFRIVRLLGTGGMGAVYLGERIEQFVQTVAIKILHPHLFPEIAESKIERESQILAALEHPGIVRMLDLGITSANLRYIVMEYVDGVPLDEWCDRRNLSIRKRVELLIEVMEAVEYAHRHFVIHADLKPENILVTSEGKPRLLDFGVAAILSELQVSESRRQEPEPLLSDSAQAAESYTALYASPEQRSGERLTVASDLYSLGLIAQLLLTGVPPKPLPIGILHSSPAGTSTATTARKMRQLGKVEPATLERYAASRGRTPGGLAGAVEGDIEAILAKALRIAPEERFRSVQEMRDEFQSCLLGYPIRTRPARWPYKLRKLALRNRVAASFAFVFLLAVILSTVGVVVKTAQATQKRRIAIARLHDLVRLTDALAGELYESVRGLPGAESAQTALLTRAHQTIDALAADQDQSQDPDPELQIELAGEYEKLARLELSRPAPSAATTSQAVADLNKAIVILQQLHGGDAQTAAARERLPELIHLMHQGDSSPQH